MRRVQSQPGAQYAQRLRMDLATGNLSTLGRYASTAGSGPVEEVTFNWRRGRTHEEPAYEKPRWAEGVLQYDAGIDPNWSIFEIWEAYALYVDRRCEKCHSEQHQLHYDCVALTCWSRGGNRFRKNCPIEKRKRRRKSAVKKPETKFPNRATDRGCVVCERHSVSFNNDDRDTMN